MFIYLLALFYSNSVTDELPLNNNNNYQAVILPKIEYSDSFDKIIDPTANHNNDQTFNNNSIKKGYSVISFLSKINNQLFPNNYESSDDSSSVSNPLLLNNSNNNNISVPNSSVDFDIETPNSSTELSSGPFSTVCELLEAYYGAFQSQLEYDKLYRDCTKLQDTLQAKALRVLFNFQKQLDDSS